MSKNITYMTCYGVLDHQEFKCITETYYTRYLEFRNTLNGTFIILYKRFSVIDHNWQTLHQYTGSQICWHLDFLGVWHFCLGTCWHFVSMTWRHSSWGTFLHSNRFAVLHTGGFGSRSKVLHFSFGTWRTILWISLH